MGGQVLFLTLLFPCNVSCGQTLAYIDSNWSKLGGWTVEARVS